MIKKFAITKVYTKNIVTDSFQSIRNTFGLRLRGYEKMINNGTDELIREAEIKYKDLKWFRLSINPLVKGSVMITIYGEYESFRKIERTELKNKEQTEKKEVSP